VETFILLQHLAKCIFLGEKENDPEYVILIVRQEKKKMEKKDYFGVSGVHICLLC
jgi:hypothetical protein